MHRFTTTIQTWDQLASAYQDKFMDFDLYDDTYDSFCQLVEKPNAKVFEIGCGPGNITRYLLAKRPDFRVEAIDAAPYMVELAKANNPTAQVSTMDGREIDTLSSKYDAIVCGFCLPYLSKEESTKLIKDCASLLNTDGVFYFSTIEGDYQNSGYETSSNGKHKMYVYYHQEEYLQAAPKENHFELIDLVRKHYPKTEDAASTHMIFIARKMQV